MNNYWLGVTTGVIGLLIWQYAIVKGIRRFIDMVMILMEGDDTRAWAIRVIDFIPTSAVVLLLFSPVLMIICTPTPFALVGVCVPVVLVLGCGVWEANYI